jgi:hypothetical protein
MAATLVIDHDGIYDPSLLNDRLLLGLDTTPPMHQEWRFCRLLIA